MPLRWVLSGSGSNRLSVPNYRWLGQDGTNSCPESVWHLTRVGWRNCPWMVFFYFLAFFLHVQSQKSSGNLGEFSSCGPWSPGSGVLFGLFLFCFFVFSTIIWMSWKGPDVRVRDFRSGGREPSGKCAGSSGKLRNDASSPASEACFEWK